MTVAPQPRTSGPGHRYRGRHYAHALLLAALATPVAAQQPANTPPTAAAIAGYYEQLQSGDAAGRQALVRHSASAAPFLLGKLAAPDANVDSLLYLIGYLEQTAIPTFARACGEDPAAESTVPRSLALRALASIRAQDAKHQSLKHDAALANLSSNDQKVLEPTFELLRQNRSLTELHLAAPQPVGPRCAAAILGSPPVPLPALRAAVHDVSPFVRKQAAVAIAAIDGPHANAVLVELTVDPNALVRKTAWRTLTARFAANPSDHLDLGPLLQNRLETRIGPYGQATFEELRLRTDLVEQLHTAGKHALPLFEATLELPRPEEFWLAVEVDKVRSQALAGMLKMGLDAQPALAALARHLRGEAWDLKLRHQGLQILRTIDVPHNLEAELCQRAYDYALAVKPIEGLHEGYLRYFRDQQNQLIEAAVGGLAITGDEAMLNQLDQAGRALAPTVMLAARLRSSAWDKSLALQASATLTELGNDRTAREAAFLKAFSERVQAGDCPPEIVRQLLATCERFAGVHRKSSRPYHYLHAPALEALRAIAQTLSVDERTKLVDRLIDVGNAPGANATALANLCVQIDEQLASKRRDRGSIGHYLHGKLLHVAPHLLIADLASLDEEVRKHSEQSLRTYARGTPEAHEQFRLLLQKQQLPDARRALSILAKLEPPTSLEPELTPWLLRESQAYEVLGAMRPVRVRVMRKLLGAITSHNQTGEPDSHNISKLRSLTRGMQKLGRRGSGYVPELVALIQREPWTASYIAHALPFLGRKGLEAAFAMEATVREPESYAIRNALYADSDPNAQLELLAFLMLRNQPCEGLAEAIRPCLRAKDKRLQRRARMLLANLAPDSIAATHAMLECLSYDRELRHFAARALTNKADDPRVAGYLHWLQFDEDSFVQRVAREALR